MNFSRRLLICLLACPILGPVGRPHAAAGDGVLLELPTLGGPQIWTDYVIHGEWRIQKHATIGHYRLLDPRERRVTFGTLDQCYTELDTRRIRGEIPPMPPHVVIALHGLAGTRGIMQGLANELSEKGGFTVLNFGYASTKGTIQEHTVALESVLRNLQGVREVSFVGHSLGNILVRHLLYRFQTMGNPPPIAFGRMVMISPPNHGADIADTIGQIRIVKLVAGDVVDQFAPDKEWPQTEQQLLTPWFEFGIIAGGRGNDFGYMPRVEGDDDGLISIRSHMLDGASDFLQTGGLHQLMPRYRSVRDATLTFLLEGHF